MVQEGIHALRHITKGSTNDFLTICMNAYVNRNVHGGKGGRSENLQIYVTS